MRQAAENFGFCPAHQAFRELPRHSAECLISGFAANIYTYTIPNFVYIKLFSLCIHKHNTKPILFGIHKYHIKLRSIVCVLCIGKTMRRFDKTTRKSDHDVNFQPFLCQKFYFESVFEYKTSPKSIFSFLQ